MTVQKEVNNVHSFGFWGRAFEAVRRLSYQEKQDLWAMLEELYYGTTPTEIQVNEFVGQDVETWAEWLGLTEDEIFDREVDE